MRSIGVIVGAQSATGAVARSGLGDALLRSALRGELGLLRVSVITQRLQTATEKLSTALTA